MCLKNSAVLQGYMAKINTASISTKGHEAELRVHINHKVDDINKIKCEIKSNDEEIYTFESVPMIEEMENVFVNVDESFVKEKNTWKKEADSEISVNGNTHDTDADSGSSEVTSTQGHTTNKKELSTPATKSHKCLTCSKTFSKKSKLQRHARVHTGEKPYKCALCEKGFVQKSDVVVHLRIHTGEKPYKCTSCKKCFTQRSSLVTHMRRHTGEKPFKCSRCEKGFSLKSDLERHMRTHTGEKPYECATCKKCFSQKYNLRTHMRVHTVEKPNE